MRVDVSSRKSYCALRLECSGAGPAWCGPVTPALNTHHTSHLSPSPASQLSSLNTPLQRPERQPMFLKYFLLRVVARLRAVVLCRQGRRERERLSVTPPVSRQLLQSADQLNIRNTPASQSLLSRSSRKLFFFTTLASNLYSAIENLYSETFFRSKSFNNPLVMSLHCQGTDKYNFNIKYF